MHKSSMLRMEWFANRYLDQNKSTTVLDVGSYDVNGNYKEIFTSRGHKYVGLDMENGPNVDIVPKQIYKWDEIDNDSYDIVVSGQALEHIEFFWITVSEMTRITKKNGLICIIAPNGFEEHRYPVDCWRFFTDGMIALAKLYNLEVQHAHTNCAPQQSNDEWYSDDCADTMIVMKKTYSGETEIINLENYRCIPQVHEEVRGGMITHKEYKKKEKNRTNNQVEVDIEETNKIEKGKIKTLRKAIRRIRYKLQTVVDRR